MLRTRITTQNISLRRMARSLFAFSGLFTLVGGFAMLQLSPADRGFAASVVSEVAKGHLSGVNPVHLNTLDLSVLQPGDVILCHNPLGSYGYWTHAVLYVGHGDVADSCDFVLGTALTALAKFHRYAQILILRPHLSLNQRLAVATTARKEVGKPYDPFAPLSDTKSQYCTKLIWQVFREHGLTISSGKRWVTPDDFAKSADFTHIVPHSRNVLTSASVAPSSLKRRTAVC